jgi:hypothetical protein
VSTSVEKVNGTPVASHAEPRPDPRAVAEAEAIRVEAEARAEALRVKAEGEKALKIEQAEQLRLDNDKQRLANQRNELRFRREKAVEEAKIAEANAKKEAAERASRDAREADDAQRAEEQKQAAEVAQVDDRWRKYALTFYIVCAIVALPVQVAAFYNPHAIWLMAAPLMLEGGAWVVLKGAAAAVASHRPHWHYRLIAWLLAFIAAGINLAHGLIAFDVATAVGTAFASVAGPGVWDLHEHGRIRKRDGVLTRKERRAQRKQERAEVARKAAEETRLAAEKEAADKAAEEAAAKLAKDRESMFPEVWDHALRLAAALGETTVTDAVWRRAHKDVKGTDPGDSPEAQQLRNAAARRMLDARADAPEKTVWKIQDAQVNPQVPPTGRRGSVTGPPVRGTRRAGDTPKFVDAARRQAAITAKNAAQKDQS